MALSLDCETDYFNSVAGVLQRDIFTPFLFTTRKNYVQQTSIGLTGENNLTIIKKKK